MITDPQDLKGRVLEDRYHVERQLGAGGMGTVWLAEDRKFDGGRPVVIKMPHPEILLREGFRERFEQEIKSLVSLELSGVVRVLDVGRFGETPFCVLQYLRGGSLSLRYGERQSPEQVLSWLVPVARILDRIHRRGVVHRDIKPDNILFDDEGDVYVADFGIAKAVGSSDTGLTMTGQTPGTPKYMAPECATSTPLSPAYDQYALAVMVYESLAGCLPHQGDSAIELLTSRQIHPARPLIEVAPQSSAALSAVLDRALVQEPGGRHASCLAFAQAFAGASTGQHPVVATNDSFELMADGSPVSPISSGAMEPAVVASPPANLAPDADTPKDPKPRVGFNLSMALGKLKLTLTIACTLLLTIGLYPFLSKNHSAGPPAAMEPGSAEFTAEAPSLETLALRAGTEGEAKGPPRPDDQARAPEGARGGFKGNAEKSGKSGDEYEHTLGASFGDGSKEIPFKTKRERLAMLQPEEGSWMSNAIAELRGRLSGSGVTLEIDGQLVALEEDGTFVFGATLGQEGANEICLITQDDLGNIQERILTLHRDTFGPKLQILEPISGSKFVVGDEVRIAGTVEDDSDVVISVEGVEVPAVDGAWQATIPAPRSPGVHQIEIVARDAAGNIAQTSCTIEVER